MKNMFIFNYYSDETTVPAIGDSVYHRKHFYVVTLLKIMIIERAYTKHFRLSSAIENQLLINAYQ